MYMFWTFKLSFVEDILAFLGYSLKNLANFFSNLLVTLFLLMLRFHSAKGQVPLKSCCAGSGIFQTDLRRQIVGVGRRPERLRPRGRRQGLGCGVTHFRAGLGRRRRWRLVEARGWSRPRRRGRNWVRGVLGGYWGSLVGLDKCHKTFYGCNLRMFIIA